MSLTGLNFCGLRSYFFPTFLRVLLSSKEKRRQRMLHVALLLAAEPNKYIFTSDSYTFKRFNLVAQRASKIYHLCFFSPFCPTFSMYHQYVAHWTNLHENLVLVTLVKICFRKYKFVEHRTKMSFYTVWIRKTN